jgi:endoglycosylceramidase
MGLHPWLRVWRFVETGRSRMLRSRLQIVTLLVAALAAACGENDSFAPGTSNGLPALVPLHATRNAAPGILDAAGRRVILRGMNLNSLGDYYQANPDYPPVLPLTDTDFQRMASYGFNVVRLVLSWSSLEPQPDVISADYIQRIKAAVAAAKASGIYVVLDMHQDAWGKYIASPPGTVCPPGTEVAIGWDGAPQWATMTDGKSTCRAPGFRELSPAVSAAFANFYADTDGIQTQLINAWAALVREFASEPAVAGYDLFNEPHWGTVPASAPPKLAAFYTRVIDAIRGAEQEAGGFAHIVFFEPVILWPASLTTLAPSFTADENIVFAPHNYGESDNAMTIEQVFARAEADAAVYGTTFWIGEYGWFTDPAGNKSRVIRYAQEEDRLLVGGTWWQWKQACGDPHTIGTPDGQPPPEFIVFHFMKCPGDIDGGPIPEWVAVLSRPYPRAAPGRLLSIESDGDAGTLHLTGMTDSPANGSLDLWVPDRGKGQPVPSGTGLGATRVITVTGGYRLLIEVSGSYAITID